METLLYRKMSCHPPTLELLSKQCHARWSEQVVCGSMGVPTATVRMRGPDGIARTATGMGTGPVDAAYKAVDALVRVQARA